MFDIDGYKNIQIALLPNETVYIPFTFLTLIPTSAETSSFKLLSSDYTRPAIAESKNSHYDQKESKDFKDFKHEEGKYYPIDSKNEPPKRVVEVKVISGTHGHFVNILKASIFPRPFVLDRTIRFYEAENSIMKKRIQYIGHENITEFPFNMQEHSNSKYVHCVESHSNHNENSSRVVIEWGPSSDEFSGIGSLDLLIRYRCGSFPSLGMFYLLIFSDPYQSNLHEVNYLYFPTLKYIYILGSKFN